jgi:hypothetical protein
MPKEVFISYDNRDVDIASRLCDRLEKAGWNCWFAPRDVAEGIGFPEQIVTAIEEADFLVLVLSRHSNTNEYVENELNLAVQYKTRTITFALEEFDVSKGLQFFISTKQWVKAPRPTSESHIDTLIATLCHLRDGLTPVVTSRNWRPLFARGLTALAAIALVLAWWHPWKADSGNAPTTPQELTEASVPSVVLGDPGLAAPESPDVRDATFNRPEVHPHVNGPDTSTIREIAEQPHDIVSTDFPRPVDIMPDLSTSDSGTKGIYADQLEPRQEDTSPVLSLPAKPKLEKQTNSSKRGEVRPPRESTPSPEAPLRFRPLPSSVEE